MKLIARMSLAVTSDVLRSPFRLSVAADACESIAWKLR